MKLFDKKPKDERVVAETNRIYKAGYMILTFGILVDLYLQFSSVNGSGFSVRPVELGIFMLAQIACLVMMVRKGLADDNRYAEDVYKRQMQFPGQNRKSTHQKSSGAVLSNSPELFINVIFSKFYFATDPFYFFKNKIIRTRPRINTAKMAMFITVLIAAGKYPDRRCDRPQYPGCDCRAEVTCPPKKLNLTLTTRDATINTQGE